MTRAVGGGRGALERRTLYATRSTAREQTPCLLETHAEIGPDQAIEPGGAFESFRTFVLIDDSTERERRGLALRRMYRTIAPWSQENPILMHVRSADPGDGEARRGPGRGRRVRDGDPDFRERLRHRERGPAYLAEISELVAYARAKGIELGGYSLVASRDRGGGRRDQPEDGQAGRGGLRRLSLSRQPLGQGLLPQAPAVLSRRTASSLEHDGSYPGDVCASTAHPGHRGLDDSQWTQWQTIREFYRWCRAEAST